MGRQGQEDRLCAVRARRRPRRRVERGAAVEHRVPRRAPPMTRALLGLSLALAACKADLPSLTDAKGTLDGACTGPYADTVIDVYPSSLATPNAALGAPDTTTVTL